MREPNNFSDKENKKKNQVFPDSFLAKTVKNNPGVSVETHCRIVGYIARELIKRSPEWFRTIFFPQGSELIAAAHDIGKISPAFQEKIYRDIGKVLGIKNPELDKAIGYHFTVSQAAIKGCPKYIPEILGRHHGINPTNIDAADSEKYGGHEWQDKRMELLDILKKDFDDWPKILSNLHSDVIAGLTTVSDWVGSGAIFDYAKNEPWQNNISVALDHAGFINPTIRKDLTFEDIFSFSPRVIQNHLVQSIKTQGVYVLEAPMGIGKTEAALYAAYKALEQERATGIYFALPTQLTSDKIYERMNEFLSKILADKDIHKRSLLLHSSAWLHDTELGEDGAPGHSWFNSSKRGLLAPFAVGTVDQALMAVMNVKHNFVRTFGLAGKVVILDEVHSYDNYTGTILKELVIALRELYCTVIILSATLTEKHRYSIMGLSDKSAKKTAPYPVISAQPKNGQLSELETESLEDYKVFIKMFSNNELAKEEALLRAERGEQVLWIENTVNEAQDIYCFFSARAHEINVDCGLIHSRFIKVDRQKNEEKWVNFFGKKGYCSRQEKGRILVGTQVLEQSIDIDADFLVTRICPIDMMCQRIGRLWRHRENDAIRPEKAQREVWILSPKLEDAVKNKASLGKSAFVYSPYILCRTIEVCQDRDSIILPKDMRLLLESTYEERKEENGMAKYKLDMEKRRETLQGFALHSISRGETKASTRYSEIDSVEVLLIRKGSNTEKGVLLRFLDDSELLLPKVVDVKTRRRIAAELLKHTVMVPEYLAPVVSINQIKWLKEYVYLGNDRYKYDEDEGCPFRVAIVFENGMLQGIGNKEISDKYEISYDFYLGYKAKKIGGIRDDDTE